MKIELFSIVISIHFTKCDYYYIMKNTVHFANIIYIYTYIYSCLFKRFFHRLRKGINIKNSPISVQFYSNGISFVVQYCHITIRLSEKCLSFHLFTSFIFIQT